MTKSKKEDVVVTATLKGNEYERTCQVRAVKTTHPLAPASPGYSKVEILDPDDDFPDGSYELDVDGQVFRGTKLDGKYVNFS